MWRKNKKQRTIFKSDNMDKVIEIQKLNECNLLKDKFAEVELQS